MGRKLKRDDQPTRFMALKPERIADLARRLADHLAGGGTLAELQDADAELYGVLACYLAASGQPIAAGPAGQLVEEWFDLADLIEQVLARVWIHVVEQQWLSDVYGPQPVRMPCYGHPEWFEFWIAADPDSVFLLTIQLSQDRGKTYHDPFVMFPGLGCF